MKLLLSLELKHQETVCKYMTTWKQVLHQYSVLNYASRLELTLSHNELSGSDGLEVFLATVIAKFFRGRNSLYPGIVCAEKKFQLSNICTRPLWRECSRLAMLAKGLSWATKVTGQSHQATDTVLKCSSWYTFKVCNYSTDALQSWPQKWWGPLQKEA